MKNILYAIVVAIALFSNPLFANEQSSTAKKAMSIMLAGSKGKSAGDGWQNAYLNLVPRRDFRVGDHLIIKLLGSAKQVLVRFLPDGTPPDQDDGIEGGIRAVPDNKTIEVTLTTEHFDISQISIHAGHYAWDTDLGAQNGTVSLVSIKYISAAK
ncbi:hypothetical protein [Desulfobacter postgatei]|uniref:hypothetical protein n=1 Tax=Desulfobacter postgatei TaxID=2293 RepID=UPI00259AF19F|nr:hypothetical protein [uncultured Desulfobacter sp.]